MRAPKKPSQQPSGKVLRYLETSVEIDAPVSLVWRILTDTCAWPAWGPLIRAVSCSDRWITTGSTGYVHTLLGLRLPFTVTDYLHERHWSWRVAGVRATGHRMKPISHGRCRLFFAVPVFAAPYLLVCAFAARRIRRLARG